MLDRPRTCSRARWLFGFWIGKSKSFLLVSWRTIWTLFGTVELQKVTPLMCFCLSLFCYQCLQKAQRLKNNPRLSGYFVQYGRECESPNSRILDMLMCILHIGRISGEDAHTECLLWAWEIVQHLGALINIGVCTFCSPYHMLMYTIHRLLNDFWQDWGSAVNYCLRNEAGVWRGKIAVNISFLGSSSVGASP